MLPEAAGIAVAADVFVERGTFDVEQARRYLLACRAAGLGLRIHGDQLTEMGAVPLAVELGARSVDHLEATGRDGVARSPRATSSPCSCPSPPSPSLGRCLLRARSSTPERPSRSPPTSTPGAHSARASRSSARSHAPSSRLTPEEALAACTVNAAHVLGLPDRGRIAPGFGRTSSCVDAPDWRHLAYHFAGDVVHTVVRGGRVAHSRA